MPSVTFEAAADGHVVGYSGAGQRVDTAAQEATVESYRPSGGLLQTTCALLSFDTSGLPDGAAIDSAYLRLYVDSTTPLYGGYYDWGDTIGVEDWSESRSTTAIDREAAPGGGWHSYPLASTVGISATGLTKLRLHTKVGPTGAPVGFRIRLRFRTREYDGYAPQLIVNYSEAGQQQDETPPPASTQEDETQTEDIFGTLPLTVIGTGGEVASTVIPRAALWRLVLCDSLGRPISELTRLGRGRHLSVRLNRPWQLTFQVPSDDDRVAGIHVDGLPRLEVLARTVKAYRQHPLPDGSQEWRLRFTGWVWQLEDSGDADAATTQVVCVDSFQTLSRRHTAADVTFADENGARIALQLIDQANAVAPTGITTSGSVVETSPNRTVSYQYHEIGGALAELASAFNGFDLYFQPVDRADGVLARFHAFARLGRNQPGVVFGWGVGPNNVREISRLRDGQATTNDLLALGAEGITHRPERIPPIGPYLEAVSSYSDVTNPEYLEALAQEELRFRARPREIVRIVPQAGRAPQPWTHVMLGDTVEVYAGARLRGGFAGVMRVYGWNVELSDDGVEQVPEYLASPSE